MVRRRTDFESERKAKAIRMGMFNIVLYILTFVVGVLLIPAGIVIVLLYGGGLVAGRLSRTPKKK